MLFENVSVDSGQSIAHDLSTAMDEGNKNNPHPMPPTTTESRSNAPLSPPDGTFHGHPMYYTKRAVHSEVRCIGDNFQKTAWYYRSCLFRNMCYDLKAKEFVIYTDQKRLERNDMYISSSPFNKTVAGGGQPAGWFLIAARGEFSPTIRTTHVEGFYQLTPDVVWLPYFPQSACNPGHLVWDTFLPLYILMEVFDIRSLKPLLFQMSHPAESNDREYLDSHMCPETLEKFLPLMGVFNLSKVSNESFIDASFVGERKSDLICSPISATGVGMYTDHGLNQHGQKVRDYELPHNVGRALLLRRFRQFALHNALIPDIGIQANKTFTVTFSVSSSTAPQRNTHFTKQIKAVHDAFAITALTDVSIKAVALRKLTLQEQISLCTQSAVFVTAGGGGTVTATFLPKGATLIIFYHEREEDGMAIKMDWDLWNHYADIKVHWLPLKSMDKSDDLQILVDIIKRDLRVLRDDLEDGRLKS